MQRLFVITMLASAATCGTAVAQDEPERGNSGAALEITMTLLPASAQTPDAVTKVIELPRDTDGNTIPSAAGVENSARGLETANAARENGRAFGEAASAAARENREDATRASRGAASREHPTPPEMPETPETPDRPAPPGR
jgi:hypothetical protein